MGKIIYADHSATTYVKDEVIKEMLPYFTLNYGNPSSAYSIGRVSKEALEKSRKKVAKAIGAESNEIYFTAGGSESDNMIIKGIARANKSKGKHIITTKIEHLAVLNTCRELEEEGFEVTYLDVDDKGFINLDELKRNIRSDTILISVMFANNEIGTIEPIHEIGKIAKDIGIIFHTDAVQAVGNVDIDVKKLNIDVDKVIYIDIDKETGLKRVLGRRTCPKCKKGYNVLTGYNKPKEEELCDDCHVKLEQRTDDNKESYEKRYDVYKEETKPVIEYFDSLGKLITIDGKVEPEKMLDSLMARLGVKND